MRTSEERLVQDIQESNVSRDQAKVAAANFNLLDLPEIDLIMQCIKTIDDKPGKGGNDMRLKGLSDRNIEKLNERASELRRRRAQEYLRKPSPNTQ